MFNLISILAIVILCSLQGVLKKPYTDKTNGKGVYFFTAATAFFALVFFVISADGFEFKTGVLPYAAAFAIFYCLSTVFTVLAVPIGPLSLTTLMISYSLLLPTFYGILFLDDKVTTGLVVGIVLLLISIFLSNGKIEGTGISVKWLIYAAIASVSNGMCSVMQKMEQVAFDGAFKNEFMIMALTIVTVVMILMIFLKERKEIKFYVKSGWLICTACGVMNGMVNLLTMVVMGKMPLSVFYPVLSAGGLLATYLLSKFMYKEKLTKLQFAGLTVGMVSAVFLNI